MHQIIGTTYAEKVEMYEKINKKQLIEMLIEANKLIDQLTTNNKGFLLTKPYNNINP